MRPGLASDSQQRRVSDQTQTQSASAEKKSQREQAEEDLKHQEKQRILGVVPNFNTTDNQDAVPLSVGQKFRLVYRSAVDPFTFVAAALNAGYGQAQDENEGYGQGVEGYAKRFGANYVDAADGIFWGNAVPPSLLREPMAAPQYRWSGEISKAASTSGYQRAGFWHWKLRASCVSPVPMYWACFG